MLRIIKEIGDILIANYTRLTLSTQPSWSPKRKEVFTE